MSSLAQDFISAVRGLRRSPSYSACAILVLALGISATTAAYSLLHHIVLRSLPFSEPDRLVVLGHESAANPTSQLMMTPALYTYYRSETDALSEIALFRYGGALVERGYGIEQEVTFTETTPELAVALGEQPALGRWINEDDARAGRAVAVLGHDLWVGRFGADPSVVGRTIDLSRGTHEIVGVMGDGFSFPANTQIWVPYVVDGTAPFSPSEPFGAFRFFGIGRLAQGVTPEEALIQLAAMLPQVSEVFPGDFSTFVLDDARLRPTVEPLATWGVAQVGRTLGLLFGASIIVLLVACTNVAHLLIVRSEARRRMTAVRMALGAGRLRLARLSLAEGLLLSGVGGALGSVGALFLLRVVERFLPSQVLTRDLVARGPQVGLDPAVLGFALVVSVGTALAFSLVPMFRTVSLAEELKEGFSSVGQSPARARGARALVVAEVALTFVLLAGGALTVRSLLNLNVIDPGFAPAGKLVFTLGSGLRREDAARFHQSTLDGLRSLPGVETVGAVRCLPLTQLCHIRGPLYAEADREGRRRQAAAVVINTVTDGFFEALGLPLLAGRGIERSDHEARNGAAVLSASAAQELWPEADPIGRSFLSGVEGVGASLTVVGVVGDVQPHRLTGSAAEAQTVYTAMLGEGNAGRHPRTMRYVVQARGDPLALVDPIRRALDGQSGDARLTLIDTMEGQIARSMDATRSAAALLTLTALGALLLASVGVYVVVAYAARQRTRELAVRIVCGATPYRVRVRVLWEAGPPTLLGLGLGLLAASGLSRVLEPWLVGLDRADPVTMALASLILASVVGIATYVPAHRASVANPADALRAE